MQTLNFQSDRQRKSFLKVSLHHLQSFTKSWQHFRISLFEFWLYNDHQWSRLNQETLFWFKKHQQIVIKFQISSELSELWDWLSWWNSCISLWIFLLLILVLSFFSISCWFKTNLRLFLATSADSELF